MLSAILDAKEKRRAKLVITKKNGQQIEGELLTVKPNSLLLLDTEGKDVSVAIANIKVIRIVKNQDFGKELEFRFNNRNSSIFDKIIDVITNLLRLSGQSPYYNSPLESFAQRLL